MTASENRVAEDLTVLMALWKGDDPHHARVALASATTEQHLRPRGLVLSIDGPLSEDLERVVDEVEGGAYGRATVVRLARHSGLARTLARGIAACDTPYIARADADDINEPERFEEQMPLMRQGRCDLVGSFVVEIDERSRLRHARRGDAVVRERPTSHRDIVKYVRDHSPFHHPTVIMRASMLEKAGGYRDFPYLEDYDLWQRMIAAGARTANVPRPLVRYRVTTSLFKRRGGMVLFRSDVRLQRELLAAGLTSRPRALKNLVGRATYRAMPARLRAFAYWLVIERGVGR